MGAEAAGSLVSGGVANGSESNRELAHAVLRTCGQTYVLSQRLPGGDSPNALQARCLFENLNEIDGLVERTPLRIAHLLQDAPLAGCFDESARRSVSNAEARSNI